MAKDNRTILRGIRLLKRETIKGKKKPRLVSVIFTDGMEDELAAQYSDEQLTQMLERGDITGEWKSTKVAAA